MALPKETLALAILRDLGKHLDCFGAFDMSDPVCKKHCILCLRCIIEKNKNFEMDMVDDATFYEAVSMRLN